MTTKVYPENQELRFTLLMIKAMDMDQLLLAQMAIREAISKLTTERGTLEFDRKMAAGTL